jgi:hypothetical protein
MPRLQELPRSGAIPGTARQIPVSRRVPSITVFANLLVLMLLFVADGPCQGAALDFRIEQQEGTDLILVRVPNAGVHKLEIDDAFEFRTPVVVQTFSGSSFQFHANEAGLMPGVDYHVRLDGGQPRGFRLRLGASLNQPAANCEMLRATWEEDGRLRTGVAFSGVRWERGLGRWVLIPHTYLVGQAISSAELFLRPALWAARACGDFQTLDEIAQYYLLMLEQTETVGALLKRPNLTMEASQRLGHTDRSARTFAASFGDQAGEAELFNSQWLHPAAWLVRLISLLPQQRRTSAMKSFAAEYTPFIVGEQLERYLVQECLPAPGGGPCVAHVERWKRAMQGLKGPLPWDTAMSDIDLWLLASAAEILGAHANDPALAPLRPDQVGMLRSAVETGIRFFQSKRTDYAETKDFQGRRVGSASYFNGDYTALPDYDYSGVTSDKFPLPSQKKVHAGASWDIGHFYRVPVFLRALYENRKATGSQFPSYHDLQMVVNQYLYRVFNGDFSHPLFHNYFDGSDGWFRVGFNGAGFGHAPSTYCDMRSDRQRCLTPGQIIGWGPLAFVNPDLMRLEQALVSLGLDDKLETREFRARYYFYEYSYQIVSSEETSKKIYGTALYYVIAENAGMITERTETPQIPPNGRMDVPIRP